MLHWLASVTEQASQATSTGRSHLWIALVLYNRLIGSTTDRLVEIAPSPVLVVK